ncbi:MAG: hypothetical protein ACC628_13595 [Pirellulaceae bacterium]
MTRFQNVFEAIHRDGHDENFLPSLSDEFTPTDAAPGSDQKIDLLRQRIAMGLPLWHDEDRGDYADLVGAIPPRRA